MLTPLAFEIVFVAVLGYLFNQSQVQVVRENRARTVVSDLIRLRELIGVINTEVGKKSLDVNLSRYDEAAANNLTSFLDSEVKAQRVFRNLKENLTSEPGSLESLKELERGFSQWISLQRTIMGYLSNGDEHLARESMRCSHRFSDRLLNAEIDLRRIFSSRGAAHPERVDESSRPLNTLLLVGLLVSILTAVAMAIYFSHSITGRLQRLGDNSNLLAARKDLLPPTGGNDEIAELDKVFHQMADVIAESSRQERAFSANLEAILRTIPVGLVVTTGLGTIEKVNQAMEKLCRKQACELENTNLIALFEGEGRDRLTEMLMEKGESKTFLARLAKFNVDVEVQAAVFQSSDGDRHLVVVEDVTERERVVQFRKDMVATVSHDLRSPLGTIGAFLELLGKGRFGELDERGKTRNLAARELVDRMANLIGDLLDSERLDSGKLELNLELVELASIIDASLESVKAQSEKKEISVVVEPADIRLRGDKERLVQVLVNLLSNAIKFSPLKSQVKVSVIVIDSDIDQKADGLCMIRVIDQAGGIPKQILSTLFDPFVQSGAQDSAQRKGFGLGLSICRSIVALHNGAIRVESEEGIGSTFVVSLPLAGPHTAEVLQKGEKELES